MTTYDALARGEMPAEGALRSTFRDHAVRLAERADAAMTHPGVPPRDDRWARLSAPYRPPVLSAGTDTGARAETAAGPLFHTHGFTVDADRVEALRGLAVRTGSTLYAPVLTAYYRALAATTGRADLVLGLAVSGRDDALPDVHRVFGPFATAVPLRPAGPASGRTDGTGFEDDLRRLAAEPPRRGRTRGLCRRCPTGFPGLPVLLHLSGLLRSRPGERRDSDGRPGRR